MSIDTLRTSKMRSALTVLGVVIGITSIVGMTSLIRGFDESLRDSIRALGPEHGLRAEVQRRQLRLGQVVPGDREAAQHHAARTRAPWRSGSVRRSASSTSGSAGGGNDRSRVYYGHEKTTRCCRSSARRRTSPPSTSSSSSWAGCSPPPKSSTAARSSCSARTRTSRSFRTSIRLARRCGSAPTSSPSIGVFGKRPSPGGFGGADDFVVIPFTAHEKFYGKVAEGLHRRPPDPRRGPQRDDRDRARRRRHARAGDGGSGGGHAHPPQPQARRTERLRPRHAGRRS